MYSCLHTAFRILHNSKVTSIGRQNAVWCRTDSMKWGFFVCLLFCFVLFVKLKVSKKQVGFVFCLFVFIFKEAKFLGRLRNLNFWPIFCVCMEKELVRRMGHRCTVDSIFQWAFGNSWWILWIWLGIYWAAGNEMCSSALQQKTRLFNLVIWFYRKLHRSSYLIFVMNVNAAAKWFIAGSS